jgi:hypothetical protein|tara:strand:- start:8435 stop:8656 length:222 start_codon:yes stop_codon:yes gene_type:complete
MKIELYTQCKLQRGNVISYSWIPKKFAVKNKYLKLKDNGKWTNGWQVIEVWSTRKNSEINDDEYRYHRQRTDI